MKVSANDITGAGQPEHKHSAYNPAKQKAVPSYVQDVIDKLSTPMPDEEIFAGPEPNPRDKVVTALAERVKIVNDARTLTDRVSREKLSRICDTMLNDGYNMQILKRFAVLDTSPETLAAIREIFEDNATLPTEEDVEAVAAVSRAVLRHIYTSKSRDPIKNELKTPLIAWRIKENLCQYVQSYSEVLVNPEGPHNHKQMEEFVANISAADLVLWNHDIWRAAINGCESFENTPLSEDIVDIITPMFWQYDLPIALGSAGTEPFLIHKEGYQCTGFVLMPYVEDVTSKQASADAQCPECESNIGHQVEHFIETSGLKFARRGISIGIVFMPVGIKVEDAIPEVHFIEALFEGDTIRSPLECLILSGAKFLTLKYVAMDSVAVSNKELKQDRKLFKAVRHKKVQIPPIKVINLRRAEVRTPKEYKSEGEHQKRQYKCHFFVDPHWRKQWYPSLQRHKPIRILTYVKGDLSKPLLTHREKVYKAVR
jgi:hypothetical protein